MAKSRAKSLMGFQCFLRTSTATRGGVFNLGLDNWVLQSTHKYAGWFFIGLFRPEKSRTDNAFSSPAHHRIPWSSGPPHNKTRGACSQIQGNSECIIQWPEIKNILKCNLSNTMVASSTSFLPFDFAFLPLDVSAWNQWTLFMASLLSSIENTPRILLSKQRHLWSKNSKPKLNWLHMNWLLNIVNHVHTNKRASLRVCTFCLSAVKLLCLVLR